MSDWVEAWDEGGNLYYYNNATGDSSWEKPAGFGGDGGGEAAPAQADGPKWVECDDPDSGAKYYCELWYCTRLILPLRSRCLTPRLWAASTRHRMRRCADNNITGECVWEKPADYDGDGKPPSEELLAKAMKAHLRLARMDKDTRAKVLAAQESMRQLKASGKVVEWVESYDPTSDAFYYYNNLTGETVWDKPDNYIMAAEDEMISAVVKIQCMYRKRHAGKEKRRRSVVADAPAAAAAAEATKASAASAGDEGKKVVFTMEDTAGDKAAAPAKGGASEAKEEAEWLEVMDASAGVPYYYNTKTGECVWDPPEGFTGAKANIEDEALMGRILKSKMMLATMDKDMLKALNKSRKVAEEAKKSDWVEMFDPNAKAYYYWNKKTNEQRWDKPETYMMTADDAIIIAVVKIQCLFRRKLAASGVKLEKKKRNPWIEVMDEAAGVPYYYNEVTGDVTWDKPADYGGKTSEDAPKELLDKILKAKLRRAMLDKDTLKRVDTHMEEMKKLKEAGKTDVWVACFDPSAEAYYYSNKATGEVTWDKPADFILAADDEEMMAVVKLQTLFRSKLAARGVQIKKDPWVEVMDESSGRPYYYHQETGEVVWEKPGEFKGRTSADAPKALLEKILKARLTRATMDDATRRKLDAHLREQESIRASGAADVWVAAFDPARQAFYYSNMQTGQVQWEKPAEYVMAADDETMTSVIRIQSLYRSRVARLKAKAMVHSTENISQEKAAAARQRMMELNEEEARMKKEMEDLRKKKADEKMLKRQLEKASAAEREAIMKAHEEKQRQERIEQQNQELLEQRRKARHERREADRKRREEREEKLKWVRRRMEEKARKEAAEQAERERIAKEAREKRDRERKARREAEEKKWKEDCAEWAVNWAETKRKTAERDLGFQREKEKEQESLQQAMKAREAFKAERAVLADTSVQSVWDAAINGATEERSHVLVAMAMKEAEDAKQREARGEKPEAPAATKPGQLPPLRASTGTSTDSPALWHVNCGNELGESPLHVAAWAGHVHMCRALIDAGANVNLTDCAASLTTPLHLATRAGWRPVVELLCEEGAKVLAQDSHGDTPLHCASRRGDRGMCSMLLDAHAKHEAEFDFFNTVSGAHGEQSAEGRIKALATVKNYKGLTAYGVAGNDNCRVLLRQYEPKITVVGFDTVKPRATATAASAASGGAGRRSSAKASGKPPRASIGVSSRGSRRDSADTRGSGGRARASRGSRK